MQPAVTDPDTTKVIEETIRRYTRGFLMRAFWDHDITAQDLNTLLDRLDRE